MIMRCGVRRAVWRRCDGAVEVLCEASISVQPGEGPLDHPAAREHDEAFGDIGPFDDLDGPFADPAQCLP
jgi:hypothetical protein